MKRTGFFAIFLVAGMAAVSSMARAQDQLPAPSPIEKQLSARAKHVTEVTLDKNMLAFAAKFMDGKGKDGDKDEQAAKQMIQNLTGIYVREYEFEKDHSYTEEDVEGLRKYFESSDWSPMVRERTKGVAEGTDVYLKLVNGQMQGLFVLDAEEKELSLVLILGPIDINNLSKLGGNFGIPKDAIKKAEKKVGK